MIYLFLIGLNFPLLFGKKPELLLESHIGVIYQYLQLPIVTILIAYTVSSVAAIVVNYRRCDTIERRRIKLMLVAALIGLASVVPAAIIHDLIYSDLISRSGRDKLRKKILARLGRDTDVKATDVVFTDVAMKGKCTLYGERSKRVRPARDEKVLSGWNGWMLAAFAEASIAFGGKYDDAVRRNADFLLTRIDANGRLTRHAKINGLLEDYAGVAWGLTLAYEAVNEQRYLDAARQLVDQVIARFSDHENGGFFDTPIDHEKLITRPKDLFDNATPGGNSVMADVLLRHAHTDLATRTIESIFPLAERYPSGFGFLLGDAEWLAGSPKEIHLTGSDVSALRKVIGETYLPHRTIAYGEGATPNAYVCENFVCLEPTGDPDRFREQLARRSP